MGYTAKVLLFSKFTSDKNPTDAYTDQANPPKTKINRSTPAPIANVIKLTRTRGKIQYPSTQTD